MTIFDKIKGLFEKKDKRTPLEKRIDELTERMANYDQFCPDYTQMSENLRTLTEANSRLKESEQKWHLDGNVVFTGIMALAQIIIILIYEERNVLKSKAVNFVTKMIGRK